MIIIVTIAFIILMVTISIIVAILEADGSSPPVVGDLWSLCQPIGFGSGYIALEYIVAKFPSNPGAITAFKLLAIAIASIIWAAVNGHTLGDLTPIMESQVAVIGLLYTGIVTTAGAIWVQSYAFEEVIFYIYIYSYI
jgi:hypothetical protein